MINFLPTVFVATTLALSINVNAIETTGSEVTELDSVYNFIRTNAINRTLSLSETGTLDNQNIIYEFQRDMTFTNLLRTGDSSFAYDIVYIIKQRNWDSQNGSKVGEPRTEDRIVIQRIKVGLRKSTGKIQGFSQTISSSSRLGAGTSNLYTFELINGQLSVAQSTVGYGDYFAGGGKFYPGVSEHASTWSIGNGKLSIDNTTNNFRINPNSGEKELVDTLSFKDVEIARLPLD